MVLHVPPLVNQNSFTNPIQNTSSIQILGVLSIQPIYKLQIRAVFETGLKESCFICRSRRHPVGRSWRRSSPSALQRWPQIGSILLPESDKTQLVRMWPCLQPTHQQVSTMTGTFLRMTSRKLKTKKCL